MGVVGYQSRWELVTNLKWRLLMILEVLVPSSGLFP